MTAKEMFEKLRYKQQVNDDEQIYYCFKTKFYTRDIIFIKYAKDICINGGYTISTTNDDPRICKYVTSIDTNLLRAINKQVEELGWLDE